MFSWSSITDLGSKSEPPPEPQGVPPILEQFFRELTEKQIHLCKKLCSDELRQSHLFQNWSDTMSPGVKRQLVLQLEALDAAYPGGLEGYLQNARDLLAKSKKGENPLQGFQPSVPTGRTFQLGSEDYYAIEQAGRAELGHVAFVLVAGGLGERLGYSNIKIGLPTELATGTCYLQFYIEYILALQHRYIDVNSNRKLPLCIMTSADTNEGTLNLLERNNYFGMTKDQIVILKQGDGVPALANNDGKFVLDSQNPFKVVCKPHGHGDIHALLYEEGIAERWVNEGIRWISFFQDTNGLAFHTLPLALGVSKEHDLIMNTLTVPRKAKQAVGAITKLSNKSTGEVRVINVEYNQLDPLLRSSGFPDGDVNDDETGYSPYPGNTNQLLFKAKEYAGYLEECRGLMPEFVNPKYKDSAKTQFKKPTRLECMMQDFPNMLRGKNAERVGFTAMPQDMTFSPVKNATEDGVKLQAKGTHPQCAASGEADQYGAVRNILKSIGCVVEEGEPEEYKGVKVVFGPEIVVKSEAMCCPAEYKEVFVNPSQVKISKNSSLVIKGSGKLRIESLDLDGALVIDCQELATGTVTDVVVKNKGWKRVPVEETKSEAIAMRGYKMEKIETETITIEKSIMDECAIL